MWSRNDTYYEIILLVMEKSGQIFIVYLEMPNFYTV